MLPAFDKACRSFMEGKDDTSRSDFDLEREKAEIAKAHGSTLSEIDRQYRIGLEVEREHDDLHAVLFPFLPRWMDLETFAGFIALAHLREMPDYYDRLKKMEGGSGSRGSD